VLTHLAGHCDYRLPHLDDGVGKSRVAFTSAADWVQILLTERGDWEM
jgi:hypothetical protein